MKYQDAINEVRAKLPKEVANAIAAEIERLSNLSGELTAACCALPLGSSAYRKAEEAVIKYRA